MQFKPYESSWAHRDSFELELPPFGDIHEFYFRMFKSGRFEESILNAEYAQVVNRYPYIDIYPCMVPLIWKLADEMEEETAEHLPVCVPSVTSVCGKLELGPLAIRFPEDGPCKTFLAFSSGTKAGVVAGDDYDAGDRISRFRLACVPTINMLLDNPDYFEAELLAKDERRAQDATPEQLERLADRARRRGNVGWSLGKAMESIPHTRRPHMAIRWTGKGRAVPKLRPVRGSIVNRKKLAEVKFQNS